MKWLSWFWEMLNKSASEPTFYLQALRLKFRESLGFYLILLFLLAVVDIGIVRLREVPTFIGEIDRQTAKTITDLPSDFTLIYVDGMLSTRGLKLPYQIQSDSEIKTRGFGDVLLTLVDNETPAVKSFSTATPTQLIAQGSPDIPLNPQGFKYKDLIGESPFSLDKSSLESKRKTLISSLPKTATIFMLLAIPFWFIGLTLMTTLTLVFLSLLANSFAWILGLRMPFLKTFQLGLHAIAVATLLDVIKFGLFPNAGVSLVIPGYLGIMVLVIWTLRSVRIVGK